MDDAARARFEGEAMLAAGSVIAGKFRVVRPLGAGGMGKVYEVEHELTKHRRALKVLHPDADAGGVERFLREASAAARIGNPHVAQTFDAERLEGGEPYLLMELLVGETLEDRLRRAGPIDPGELAVLVHQACEGMQAAHEAGIIHRDLKPGNLFVEAREDGPFVKILDFGISRFDPGHTGAHGLTKEGAVMGTPYCVAPEQVRAAAIDARTDVYALGVILYECACGQRPFEAASVERLAVLNHQGQAVPLDQRSPAVPRAFSQVVERAMAADPGERFASARAMAAALAPLRAHVIRSDASVHGGSTSPSAFPGARAAFAATLRSDPTAAGAARPSRRLRALAGLAVAGLVVGSVAAWAVARPSGQSSAARPSGESSTARPSGESSAAVASPSSAVVPEKAPVEDPFREAPAPSAVILVAPPPAIPLARGGAEDPEGGASSPSPPPARSGAHRVVAPPPPSAPRNRADDKGLAAENPFR